jgi:hypothetical protein
MDDEAAGDDKTEGPAPACWDVYEAQRWVAWRGVHWPSIGHPWGPLLPNPDTLDALAHRAEGHIYRPDWKKHIVPGWFWYASSTECDRSAVRDVCGLPFGRAYETRAELRRLMRAWNAAGLPAADLPVHARRCAEVVRVREDALSGALAELLDTLRVGRLAAFGQRPARDHLGNPTFAPAGSHELIPAEVFADRKLILHANAVTLPPGSREWWQDRDRCGALHGRASADLASPAAYPLYVEVRFRARHVRQLWKANPLRVAPSKSKHLSEAKLKGAAAALVAELPPRGRVDAEAAIKRLQELTGGNRDAARAAWSHVPEEHRNPRGAPKKAAREIRE